MNTATSGAKRPSDAPGDEELAFRKRELALRERQIEEELSLKRLELELKREELLDARIARHAQGRWLNRLGQVMVGAIPLFVALTGGAIALVELRAKHAYEAEKSILVAKEAAEVNRWKVSIEAGRESRERKKELYAKAIAVSGQLLINPTDARKQFETLYWSELPLVEDAGVESAMVAVRDCLGGRAPECSLERAVLALSREIRRDLNDDFEWTASSADQAP
jgi:hypothetical protein